MAIMLPVAAGMTMGDNAERSYSPAAPTGKSNSGPTDSSSQARQISSAPDETSTQATSRAAGIKREGQDSSEDNESTTPTRTRSKFSSSTSKAGGSSGAAAQTVQPFAAVFADAVTAARVQIQPQAEASAKAQQCAHLSESAFSGSHLAPSKLTPATPPTAASVSLPSAASSASSDLTHVAEIGVQADTSKVSQHAVEQGLQTTADSEASQSNTSSLPTVSLTLPASLTTPPATYAFKSEPPVFAVQTNEAKSSRTAAPLAPASSETTLRSASGPAQPLSVDINSARVVSTEDVGITASTPTSTVAALAVADSIKPGASLTISVPETTTEPSGTKTAAKAPLFGSLTLQSLSADSYGSGSSAAGAGEKVAAMLHPASDTTAKPTVSTAPQSLADVARRAPKSGDNAPNVNQSSGPVADSTLQANQSGNVAAVPDNGAVAQSGIQERIDVAQQLATRISAAASSASGALNPAATHTLTVDITPQHWGRMQITLTQIPTGANGASQSTATIVTESESARQAMMGQVKDLHESLQAGGVKIDKIEIVTAAKPGVAASSDSVVSGVAEASAGSLSGNAQQQSESQSQSQHHSHAGQRFEFGTGASGAGAGNSGGQGRGQQFSSLVEADAGVNSPHWISGLSSQSETNIIDIAPGAMPSSVAASAGVNVLA